MPKQKNTTDYEGVFYNLIGNGTDKEFFVEFEKNGQSFSRSVGLESEGIDVETAQTIRKKLIEGEEMVSAEDNYSQPVKKQKEDLRKKMNEVRNVLWSESGSQRS